MAAAETPLDLEEIAPPASRARRWFQFRLGSLLLLPLLLALMQRLAVDDIGKLLLLGIAIGTIFGSLWSAGRMRIVGFSRTGLRRVGPVLWATLLGGATAGMLAGPIAVWIALFRSGTWWIYGPRQQLVFSQAAWELATSGLYGTSIGALLGIWGALIVGPAWAYLALAPHWSRMTGVAITVTSGALQTAPLRSTTSAARSLLTIVYLVGLLGFPLLVLWNACQQYREQLSVRRLREAGWMADANITNRAPHFLNTEIGFHWIKSCFRRLDDVYLSGRIDSRSLAALRNGPPVGSLLCEFSPDNRQLSDLAETVMTIFNRPVSGRMNLTLKGNRFTPAGIEALLNRTSPRSVLIVDPHAAMAAMKHLQSVSAAVSVRAWQSSGRERLVMYEVRYRGCLVYHVMAPLPPYMGPPMLIPIPHSL